MGRVREWCHYNHQYFEHHNDTDVNVNLLDRSQDLDLGGTDWVDF